MRKLRHDVEVARRDVHRWSVPRPQSLPKTPPMTPSNLRRAMEQPPVDRRTPGFVERFNRFSAKPHPKRARSWTHVESNARGPWRTGNHSDTADLSRLLRRATVLLLVTLVPAACGSNENERASARTATQTATSTRTQEGATDETQLRSLATRYVKAVFKRDWKKVCATLSPSARARLARKAGSCEAVYKSTPRAGSRSTKDLLPTEVRKRGDRATVLMGVNGVGDGDPYKLYAAKLDGRWWLYIRRAAKGAP